jgi:hypothetical protein
LGRIAEDESASGQLEQLLATNPPWRRGFFDRLPSNISDARTPLKMLLSLKDSPNPPSARDLQSYFRLLVSKGFYDVAYYAWLQFLPAAELGKVGLLFNGDFESAPSELPFDWTFAKSANVTVKVVERRDEEGGHALFLNFGGGRVKSLSARQLVMLAPGSYQFRGKYRAEFTSSRGLQWHIACLGKGAPQLGETSPMTEGSRGEWQDFSLSFTVPEASCPAQRLELFFDARSASERFISGSVWYDHLQIERELPAPQ